MLLWYKVAYDRFVCMMLGGMKDVHYIDDR